MTGDFPGTPGEARPFVQWVAPPREGGRSFDVSVTANDEECRGLARWLELPAVRSLSGRLTVRRLRGGMVRVSGRFDALVVQTCVVTLEPFEQRVEGTLSRDYSEGDARRSAAEILVDLEEDDPPDPVEAQGIDVGHLLAEELALALDPYPRGPHADSVSEGLKEQGDDEPPAASETARPFARLRAWQGRK